MGVRRNAEFLMLLFDFVMTFKFGSGILSQIPRAIHGAFEFLDINIVKGSTIWMDVCEQFNQGATGEAKEFAT